MKTIRYKNWRITTEKRGIYIIHLPPRPNTTCDYDSIKCASSLSRAKNQISQMIRGYY